MAKQKMPKQKKRAVQAQTCPSCGAATYGKAKCPKCGMAMMPMPMKK